MKKIIFTFLSCVMLTASLPVESFAAAVVPMDSSKSTAYKQLSTEKREYYSELMNSDKESAMSTLLRENSDRRKAFNKANDITKNTQKIDAILKDKNRVDVNRPATDTEKDDILKLLMATAITGPWSPSERMLTKLNTDLDAAKNSTDPLTKHCYIVDMAELLTRKLMNLDEIEGDFSTFEAFSGVDRDRFLKLFYQVKGNHRRGLESDPFANGETLQDLVAIANDKNHLRQGRALDELEKRLYTTRDEGLHEEALTMLITIANDKNHPLQGNALFKLSKALPLVHIVAAGDKLASEKALSDLIIIANKNSYPSQKNALMALSILARDEFDCSMMALDALIAIAKNNSHSLQVDALWELGGVESDGKVENICAAARQVLTTIEDDTARSEEIRAAAKLALDPTAPAAAGADVSANAQPDIADLANIAKDNTDPGRYKALWKLGNVAAEGNDEDISRKALQVLIDIARDNSYLLQNKALSTLGEVAGKTRDYNIGRKILETLFNIAHNDYYPLQNKALWMMGEIARKAASLNSNQEALLTLIDIAANDSYFHQSNALWMLVKVEKTARKPVISQKAFNALKAIAYNDADTQQLSALWYIINAKDQTEHEKALEDLINIAKDSVHTRQFDALLSLNSLIIYAKNKNTRKLILNVLIKIAKDGGIHEHTLQTLINVAKGTDHPQQVNTINLLVFLTIDGKNDNIREKALNAVIEIAKDTSHQQRIISLFALQKVAIKGNDANTRKAALNALLKIAKDESDLEQPLAFIMLDEITKFGNHENTRDAGRQALIDIRDNTEESEGIREKARLALEPPASADDGTNGPVRMRLPITQAR